MSLPLVAPDRITAELLSNHPITLEEDRVRKRQVPRPGVTWVATLIPRLPDDVARRILANVPRSNWPRLRLVAKAWKNALEDPSFYEARVDLEVIEDWCYTEFWHPVTKLVSWFAFDSTRGKWCALPPIPRERGCDPEVFGRAAASLGGDLYIAGGKAGVSGPTLRDIFIYSPLTDRWKKGPSMITTRHSPLMFSIFDRKIYVMGGFDYLDNIIETGECYDADTEKWTLVGNVNYPRLICPEWYKVGWKTPWVSFQYGGDEYYVAYNFEEAQQLMRYYIPRNGSWVDTQQREKTKALLRYSFGTETDRHIVFLDWASGRIRYCFYPTRIVGWETVPGVKDLDWVSIIQSNPKVSSVGSKLVLVGRGLSVLMIETHPTLLQANDGRFIDSFPCVSDVAELEPLHCVVVKA